MKLWNYIGELFLFRWLFGSRKHSEPKHNVSDTPSSSANSDFVDDTESYIDYDSRHNNSYSHYDDYDYDYSHSYDDFHDEQDDYDMMDDDF